MSMSGQRDRSAPTNVWLEGADTADMIKVVPTVTITPAYTAGDVLGGVQTLANANRNDNTTVMLHSVVINDKSGQNPEMTLLFFDESPTSKTDNDVFAWGSGDMDKCIGYVEITSAEWRTIASQGIATLAAIALELKPSGRNLYVVAVVTNTPDFVSTTDLIFRYGLLQG